jgi:hypothetical protein
MKTPPRLEQHPLRKGGSVMLESFQHLTCMLRPEGLDGSPQGDATG